MARIYKETAENIDKVVFNGKTYRRYPDSPRKHLQRYFTRSRAFLHRDVWVFHNGPIPRGHHVHHKDGNTLNNDITNLECVSCAQHAKEHEVARREHGRSEKQQAHLAEIRKKAAPWHSTPEGLAWHAAHGKRSWEDRERVTLTCQQCGTSFESFLSDARFCGKPCQNKNWRAAHPEYDAQKRARAKARRLQLERGRG